MSVAFDARMIRHSGIGVHIRSLLRALREERHRPPMLLLGDLNHLTTMGFHHGFDVESYTRPIYSVRAQWTFPKRLPEARTLHVPHYNIPYRYEDNLVVTVHDLIHLEFPAELDTSRARARLKHLYARYTFRQVARRADAICCVSEFTRREVMERLGVGEDRAFLLPNAVDPEFRPSGDPGELRAFRARQRLPEGYLLTVGIDKPHKNVAFLLQALKPLWEDRRLTAPLVIAGAGGPGSGLARRAADIGVAQWTIWPDWIPESEMPMLYEAASLLVFPSRYEGFGLPLLEAQRVGLPVASSNAASCPEVAGEGAVYFDPTDTEACRHAVTRALEDSALRQRLVAAGHANEGRYAWSETAGLLVELYRCL